MILIKILKLINPIVFFGAIWEHRTLIVQLTKREILSKYRGSTLGMLWSFITPLIMLVVYTFVFSIVFKGRWGVEASENKFEFALILFSGLIIFNLFSETINKSPYLITSNVNYVKRVVFPLDILPVVTLLSTLIHSLISFALLLTGLALLTTEFSFTILYSFIIVIPLLFIILGLSWFLSSISVYLRDISNFVTLAINALFFITPVFYPLSAVPDFFRQLMLLNPLTPIVENFRNAVMFHTAPSLMGLLIQTVLSYLFMVCGYLWFRRTRRGFADVL
jgi:ABC-type polysaccharide/polyol phosphate export systems, permease component